MKTYLVGSFGEHNGGDDAFAEVALWGLSRYCRPTTVVASAPAPIRTSRGIVRSTVTRRLFKGQHRLQRYLSTRNLDRVLYAGGGLHSFADALLAQETILGRNPGARCAAVGVSVWPFKDQRTIDAFKRFIEHFSFIGVRGKASFERMREIDAQVRYELTFDIAVLLREVAARAAPAAGRPRTVGVSLLTQARTYHPTLTPDQLAAADEQRLALVAGTLNALIESGSCDRVCLLDFCRHERFGDADIHERLLARLSRRVPIDHRPYDDDPLALFEQVGNLGCMIAMRLHAAVFAYTAGVPCLVLPYQDKSLEWTTQIGLEPGDVLDHGRADVAACAARVASLLSSGAPNAALPIDQATRAARRNFEVLSELGF